MAADLGNQAPNHLIVVCGHAIWTGGPTNGEDESEWIIEDWKKGETPTYMEHIKAGLKALANDERALLVFSGGPTAPASTESEARSYANLARANDYWGIRADPSRILAESRALDSYQNILLSLLAFWRATGHAHWPTRLTIVSHAFKRRRLASVHVAPAALRFPAHHVAFIGINPPGVPATLASEERAAAAWERDPHGRSEALRAKRLGRNPHGVGQLLFEGGGERTLAGLETVVSEDGMEEFLVEGGCKPWALGAEKGHDDDIGDL